jgi:hypothetical protein
LDDDVARLLESVRKSRDAGLKQIVNEALRLGLEQISRPAAPRAAFRTRPVDLGKCHFPNLDNVWDVLEEAEGESYKSG